MKKAEIEQRNKNLVETYTNDEHISTLELGRRFSLSKQSAWLILKKSGRPTRKRVITVGTKSCLACGKQYTVKGKRLIVSKYCSKACDGMRRRRTLEQEAERKRKIKVAGREYYIAHREKCLEYARTHCGIYYQKNREKLIEQQRRYQLKKREMVALHKNTSVV